MDKISKSSVSATPTNITLPGSSKKNTEKKVFDIARLETNRDQKERMMSYLQFNSIVEEYETLNAYTEANYQEIGKALKQLDKADNSLLQKNKSTISDLITSIESQEKLHGHLAYRPLMVTDNAAELLKKNGKCVTDLDIMSASPISDKSRERLVSLARNNSDPLANQKVILIFDEVVEKINLANEIIPDHVIVPPLTKLTTRGYLLDDRNDILYVHLSPMQDCERREPVFSVYNGESIDLEKAEKNYENIKYNQPLIGGLGFEQQKKSTAKKFKLDDSISQPKNDVKTDTANQQDKSKLSIADGASTSTIKSQWETTSINSGLKNEEIYHCLLKAFDASKAMLRDAHEVLSDYIKEPDSHPLVASVISQILVLPEEKSITTSDVEKIQEKLIKLYHGVLNYIYDKDSFNKHTTIIDELSASLLRMDRAIMGYMKDSNTLFINRDLMSADSHLKEYSIQSTAFSVVHEMSHAFLDTKDHAYKGRNAEGCYNMAPLFTMKADKAIENADSISALVKLLSDYKQNDPGITERISELLASAKRKDDKAFYNLKRPGVMIDPSSIERMGEWDDWQHDYVAYLIRYTPGFENIPIAIKSYSTQGVADSLFPALNPQSVRNPLDLLCKDNHYSFVKTPENDSNAPLEIVEVPRDGDCFYHSILAGLSKDEQIQLFGEELYGQQQKCIQNLRTRIANVIRERPEIIRDFIAPDSIFLSEEQVNKSESLPTFKRLISEEYHLDPVTIPEKISSSWTADFFETSTEKLELLQRAEKNKDLELFKLVAESFIPEEYPVLNMERLPGTIKSFNVSVLECIVNHELADRDILEKIYKSLISPLNGLIGQAYLYGLRPTADNYHLYPSLWRILQTSATKLYGESWHQKINESLFSTGCFYNLSTPESKHNKDFYTHLINLKHAHPSRFNIPNEILPTENQLLRYGKDKAYRKKIDNLRLNAPKLLKGQSQTVQKLIMSDMEGKRKQNETNWYNNVQAFLTYVTEINVELDSSLDKLSLTNLLRQGEYGANIIFNELLLLYKADSDVAEKMTGIYIDVLHHVLERSSKSEKVRDLSELLKLFYKKNKISSSDKVDTYLTMPMGIQTPEREKNTKKLMSLLLAHSKMKVNKKHDDFSEKLLKAMQTYYTISSAEVNSMTYTTDLNKLRQEMNKIIEDTSNEYATAGMKRYDENILLNKKDTQINILNSMLKDFALEIPIVVSEYIDINKHFQYALPAISKISPYLNTDKILAGNKLQKELDAIGLMTVFPEKLTLASKVEHNRMKDNLSSYLGRFEKNKEKVNRLVAEYAGTYIPELTDDSYKNHAEFKETSKSDAIADLFFLSELSNEQSRKANAIKRKRQEEAVISAEEAEALDAACRARSQNIQRYQTQNFIELGLRAQVERCNKLASEIFNGINTGFKTKYDIKYMYTRLESMVPQSQVGKQYLAAVRDIIDTTPLHVWVGDTERRGKAQHSVQSTDKVEERASASGSKKSEEEVANASGRLEQGLTKLRSDENTKLAEKEALENSEKISTAYASLEQRLTTLRSDEHTKLAEKETRENSEKISTAYTSLEQRLTTLRSDEHTRLAEKEARENSEKISTEYASLDQRLTKLRSEDKNPKIHVYTDAEIEKTVELSIKFRQKEVRENSEKISAAITSLEQRVKNFTSDKKDLDFSSNIKEMPLQVKLTQEIIDNSMKSLPKLALATFKAPPKTSELERRTNALIADKVAHDIERGAYEMHFFNTRPDLEKTTLGVPGSSIRDLTYSRTHEFLKNLPEPMTEGWLSHAKQRRAHSRRLATAIQSTKAGGHEAINL